MRTILLYLVVICGLIIATNPSLDDAKDNNKSMIANFIINKLTADHVGISLCRENHFFYSTFYSTVNLSGFGITATLQGCVPVFYGFCGMFFDVSEETQMAYKQQFLDADIELPTCPGECETISEYDENN